MTERVGLLGWPVEHSVSPAMHNAAFAALGLDWHYDLLPVPPGRLDVELSRLLAEGYRGFNVTVPHKQAVLAGLSLHVEPDLSVTAIGAANTLVVQPCGKITATNTDGQGFADDLRAHGIEVAGKRCLVLGTGGAAHAVVCTLKQMAALAVTCVSRDPGRVSADLQPAVDYAGIFSVPFDLVINTTPVGMWPQTHPSPWPNGLPIPQNTVIYDLIYNPAETRLMMQAQSAGARSVGGLGMLVRQGALAFERWTGIRPPIDVMRAAAETALNHRRME